MIFAACSHSPDRLVPPKTEDGKPKVELSDACEKLAKDEPPPKLKKGGKVKADTAKALGVVKTLRGRLKATRDCMKKQREDFAKGG